MLCWRYLSEFSGSLFPRTRWRAQRGSPAPLMYHLWPLMTISFPSWRMVVRMFVASEDATATSVSLRSVRCDEEHTEALRHRERRPSLAVQKRH